MFRLKCFNTEVQHSEHDNTASTSKEDLLVFGTSYSVPGAVASGPTVATPNSDACARPMFQQSRRDDNEFLPWFFVHAK